MSDLISNLPIPNLPLLRKAVEWAEAEAAKTDGTCLWDQGVYALQTDCGTAYCIAGWAIVTADDTVTVDQRGDFYRDGKWLHEPTEAERLLGLTRSEGSNLFEATNTIADVRAVAEQIAARAGDRL